MAGSSESPRGQGQLLASSGGSRYEAVLRARRGRKKDQ